MLKSIFVTVFSAVLVLLSAGCTLLQGEEERPADITVAELLARQQRATDPNHAYADAKSFIQRQIVTRPGLFYGEDKFLMETSYRKPDCFKLTTILDNQPAAEIIYNGKEAALADYRHKQVVPITGKELATLKTVFVFGTPGGDLESVFERIDLAMVTIDQVDYYKMTCVPKAEEVPVFYIYVDANSYFTKFVRTDTGGAQRYDAEILQYATCDDVMIAESCQITQGDVTEQTQLVRFKLDVNFPDDTFRIPKF